MGQSEMTPIDPFKLFTEWFEEAQREEPEFPEAMNIASVGEDGTPSLRVVLMKDFSSKGFVFYTNLKGQKGQEIVKNPKVCLNFHWKTLRKQIRITGEAQMVSTEMADRYFASRPRVSQLGAWASKQSQEMPDRFSLEKRLALYTAKFGVGPIPRPDFWTGFCVVPLKIEFWHEKPFRLHERVLYHFTSGQWISQRLFP
jgi:pyridoxamine 5'-phosphate oxidase